MGLTKIMNQNTIDPPRITGSVTDTGGFGWILIVQMTIFVKREKVRLIPYERIAKFRQKLRVNAWE